MANMQFHHWLQNLSKGLGSPDLAVVTLAQQSPHSATLHLLKRFGFHPWAPLRGIGL